MPVILRSSLLLILLITALAGCIARPEGIADLERYPQDAMVYLQARDAAKPLIPADLQAQFDARYNEQFFAPWQLQRASLPASEAFWGVAAYGGRLGYAENLQPLTKERWQQLVTALQRDSYPALARPAITVRNTACRVFPTYRPFFFDPRQPGEGYPFDYFQNSAVWAGTPLLVTHVSLDGAWYFAETGFAAGWLPAHDVAWADAAFRTSYRTGIYAAMLRDQVTLYDDAGDYLLQAHIGAVFPILTPEGSDLRLLIPVRDANGAALTRIARPEPSAAARKPLPLQPGWVAEVVNRMIGQLYGWGGLYENRDCSATLRDLFTPFGIWLPRNSAAQAKGVGTFHDLAALDPEAKRDRLLQQGVPFYTLVWLKGHIGLYLGSDPASGELLLLHNLWGVRTSSWSGRQGRALVGRLVITSLHPGEERTDVESGRFFRGVLGMTVLPGIEPGER